MGICGSQEYKAAKARSATIDRLIEQNAESQKLCAKILLLGAGESGKSTIVKQMKIIHQNGYSPKELLPFRDTIATNVIDSITHIATAMDKYGIHPQDQQIRAYFDFLIIRPLLRTPVTVQNEPPYVTENHVHQRASRPGISPNILNDGWQAIVNSIWNDPARIKLFEEHGSDFYMMDNAPYYFAQMKRISAPDYLPTEEDVLNSRLKTTGISETYFDSGNLKIQMIDVGGQRSERRKWIHSFEGVTCIIFCVALSEYDLALYEDATKF